MIDTTIAAAYAAQHARKSGHEPITEYYCSISGQTYTYLLIDDLSIWLFDNDHMKDKIKDFGWELHVYDEQPLRLYAVPGHTPGGTPLVNKVDYCAYVDFKDSKRPSEVNFRNVVLAAKELVRRNDDCQNFIKRIQEMFTTLPEHTSLVDYVESGYDNVDSWPRKVAKKYNYDFTKANREQVLNALKVLDTLNSLVPVGQPFLKVDAGVARHWVENVLRMCSNVTDEYLSTESFGIAASIYMEDRYTSSLLDGGLQLPQIIETLNYFSK